MKRMLVPLDGSPLAEAIIPVAEEWAREEEAELILLRAVLAHHEMSDDPVEAKARAVAEGESYLNEVAERLKRRGLKRVRWNVRYDEPVTAIAGAVAREDGDLIAMATHGRSGLSRLLLGSVAEAVVRSARVPVLLIRGQSAWEPWVHGKILVPLDGSETAEAVLPLVERLAGPRALTVSLLQIIERAPFRLEDMMVSVRSEEAEQYLAKIAAPLQARGLRVRWVVGFGGAAETIVASAGEERVDLIAMATHGRSGLGRLFFGSVAERVVRSATTPVLLFKGGERDHQ